MTAIHHHFQPSRLRLEEGALAEFDVATSRIINALRLAKLRGLHAASSLSSSASMASSTSSGSLVPSAEKERCRCRNRVVGCTDDDTGFGTEGASQVGNRRVGMGPISMALRPAAESPPPVPTPACNRRYGYPLPISTFLVPFLESTLPAAQPSFMTKSGGDRVFTHLAAHAVGAEVLSGHCLFLVFLFGYEILSRHGHPACTQNIHGGPHVVHPDDPGAMLQPDQGHRPDYQPTARLPGGQAGAYHDFRDMPTKSGSW